jgi:pimeloyl-ACP methyl ester carboxylesterase
MPILWPGALVLAACVFDAPSASAFPADTLLDVGGRALEIEVRRGREPLTIVFEAGGGSTLDSWDAVPDSVAVRSGATVVTYNRAGLGRSDLGPPGLTPLDEMRDLARSLETLGVPARRIVVGTSYGAMLAVLHAGLYPDDVAGLVLVDPMNARFIAATGDFVKSTAPVPENPANDRERLIVRMSRTLDDLAAHTGAVEPDLPIPIVVIAAGEPWWGRAEIVAAWRRSHAEIAAARAERELVVAEGSGHQVAEDRPDVIVDAALKISRMALDD